MWAPLDLCRRAEHRQARSIGALASEVAPLGPGIMAYEAPGHWANQACGLADAQVPAADLDRMVGFYVSRGIEPLIEVCSLAEPRLLAQLGARGFRARGFTHALARELPRDLSRAPVPEGVEIRLLDPHDPAEGDAFDAFVRVLTPEPGRVEHLAARRAHAFLATVGSEVAGMAHLDVDGPLAALYGAAVVPAFRRRGLHRALFEARMAFAADHGCTLAQVDGPPGGATERNARRLGFSLAYSKLELVRPGEGLAPSP